MLPGLTRLAKETDVDIKVHGRHIRIFEPVQDYVREKVAKLDRFYDLIQHVEVTLSAEGDAKVAEIQIKARKGGPFVGTEKQGDFYAAIDLLVDKMGRQLRKQKEKLKQGQRSGRHSAAPVAAVPDDEERLETYQDVVERTDFGVK